MSVRYYAFIGLDPGDEYRRGHRVIGRPWPQWPFWCWRLVEDDHAPKSLSGKRVALLFRIVGRKVEIAERAVCGAVGQDPR